jgi:hypothetical protein
VTVCGQHLTPKRIIFEGDTGVFFKNKQEVELLVKFKQLEGCTLEVEKWRKYASDADLAIARERAAFNKLSAAYLESNSLAREYKTKYEGEYSEHQKTILNLNTETDRKKTWRKWAIRSGVGNLILLGTIYVLVR